MRVLFHDLKGIVSRAAAAGRRLGTTVRGPVLWLTVCGALLVAAIFAGTIMMVGEFRERALANSERELENTVLLLTRHFDQQFEDSDTIAADVIARLHIPGIASPQAFRKLMSSSEAHEILQIQSRRAVLSRRHFDLRRRRRHHQLVAAVADAGPQHLRARLLQVLQVQSAIAVDPDRGGSQPYQRQPEHGHCPSADRAKTVSFSA